VVPAAAHVFVGTARLSDAAIALAPDDAHHLVRVLRLRDGDPVTVADGLGSWRPARLRLVPGADPGLEAEGPVVLEPAARPELTVAVALPKGERGEWAVQKLTEVGVDVITPLVAERSVVRWTAERTGRGLERLARVARAAAMQSRRARLPEITPPASVAEMMGAHPGSVAAAEPGGGPPSLERPVVLVGPEGGWAPAELPGDLPRVGLGPTTLRTETAAVVTGAALGLLRAGLLLTAPP
jgi:16S rRNA (uracil1498-N3)-methyltransferase